MNRDRFVGRLEQILGRLKQHWGMLTEDQTLESTGWRTQISGLVRERRGLSSEHAERQLGEFRHRHRDWMHT